MTAVEWYIKKIKEARQMCDDVSMEMDIWHTLDVLIEKGEQAKEMEVKQRGYSEEQVREMLFMALYEHQGECCTTHTKDSIVRKVLKTFKSE